MMDVESYKVVHVLSLSGIATSFCSLDGKGLVLLVSWICLMMRNEGDQSDKGIIFNRIFLSCVAFYRNLR